MQEAKKDIVNEAEARNYSTDAASLVKMDACQFVKLEVVDKGRLASQDVGCNSSRLLDTPKWTESSAINTRNDDRNFFVPCQGRRSTGMGGRDTSGGLQRTGSDLSAVSGSGGNSEGGDESKKSLFLELGKHPSSQYKGVVPQPNGRWGAQIYEKHQRVWLGTFYREEDAAKAYDRAALKFRGRDAMTNFRPISDADPEAEFLNVHTKEQIVDMLRRHTYEEELDQRRKMATLKNNRTWGMEAVLAGQSDVGALSSVLPESGRNIHNTAGLHISTAVSPIRSLSREHLFDKAVTPSDVGKLNRLVIPKQHAERCFPLDVNTNEKGLILNFEDCSGKVWRFRYSYWNSSQSYVLTKGWSRFVKEKKLDAGDIVTFERGSNQQLFISWRRRSCNQQQTLNDASLLKPNLLDAPFQATSIRGLCPVNYPTLQVASRDFVSVNQIFDKGNQLYGGNVKQVQTMKHQFQQNMLSEKRTATDRPVLNHERIAISSPCLIPCRQQDQINPSETLNVDFNKNVESSSFYKKLSLSSSGNLNTGDWFLDVQNGFGVSVSNNVTPFDTGKQKNSPIDGILSGDNRLLLANKLQRKNCSSLVTESPEKVFRLSCAGGNGGGTLPLETLRASLHLGKNPYAQTSEISAANTVMQSEAEGTGRGLRLFGVDLKLPPVSTFESKSALELGPQLAVHDRSLIMQPHVSSRECSAKLPLASTAVKLEDVSNVRETIGSENTDLFSTRTSEDTVSGNKRRKVCQNDIESNSFHHSRE
eukprot:c24709_g2_i3 orf=360-2639(-)